MASNGWHQSCGFHRQIPFISRDGNNEKRTVGGDQEYLIWIWCGDTFQIC